MNDLMINKKIQATKLFTDAQKVDILVALADASDEDRAKLEAGIDAFDAQYSSAITKHAQQIRSILGHTTKDMSPEEKKQHEEALRVVDVGLGILSA